MVRVWLGGWCITLCCDLKKPGAGTCAVVAALRWVHGRSSKLLGAVGLAEPGTQSKPDAGHLCCVSGRIASSCLSGLSTEHGTDSVEGPRGNVVWIQ